jgi:16S rRNA (guanine1207-N2)-methyltransferase
VNTATTKDPHLSLVLQQLAPDPQRQNTLWIVDENLPIESVMTLPVASSLMAMTNRYDIHAALQARGVQSLLCDFDFSQLGQFQRIVYRISKEKLVAHHCINQAIRHLSTDGELVVIGGKQDGIKSIAKNAAQIYGQKNNTRKSGSSYLATFTRPEPLQEDQRLPCNDYGELRQVQHKGVSFFSKPGVFGWEKVDRGSELLISTLPTIQRYMKSVNSVLDLGCGWGYLMLATRTWDVETRCATDNNIAAIDAATQNFAEAGLTVDCVADDCASNIRGRYDLILCNPPFHQGFAVSDTLTEKFLAAASRLSRRSTRAVFVVNQFVPLQKHAGKYFSQSRLLLAEDGFCVYELRP